MHKHKHYSNYACRSKIGILNVIAIIYESTTPPKEI